MKIKFANPDPRDFPTLGLAGVRAGDVTDQPIDIARDLVRQGVAVHVKPKPSRAKPKPPAPVVMRGETGPEMVTLPEGSRVISSSQTRQAIQGAEPDSNEE